MSGTVRNCRAISSGSVGKCLQCVWNRPEISGNISQHFPDEVLFKVPDKVTAEIHEGEISQHFPDDVLFKVSRHRVPFILGFQKKNMVGKSLRFPDKFQRISALVYFYYFNLSIKVEK